MKKTNLIIPFEDEKLDALRRYAGKKDTDITAELEDAVQKLYEKYVPKDVREFFEMREDGETKGKTRDGKASLKASAAVKLTPEKPGAPNAAVSASPAAPPKL